MIVYAFILTYNEERLLPFTIAHYQKFCKEVFIIDNQSTDSTRDIAKIMSCHILEFDTGGTFNDGAHIEQKNNCWKPYRDFCDYAIVVDADELLYFQDKDLKEDAHGFLVGQYMSDLEGMLLQGVTLPKVEGYNMLADKFPDDYTRPITEQIMVGARFQEFDKQVIFSPKHITDINYKEGCHECNPQGKIIRSDIALKLLHYKYIDKKYVKAKHRQYRNRLSQYNRDHSFGLEYLLGDKLVDNAYKVIRERAAKII